ncbi:MAG: serine hydrolase [Bryobacteraceae bacterium]
MITLLVAALAAPLTAQAGPSAIREGFDPARLEAVRAAMQKHNSTALLVTRHGRIVLEWYAPNVRPDQPLGTASLAKALVGGMSLLAAIDHGRMNENDPAAKYIPSWKDDPRKRLITIGHLATHSSGIEDAEAEGKPHAGLTGWKGDFWKRKPEDPVSIALHKTPVLFEPGARSAYSNPGMAVLGYTVTAALRGTGAPDLKSVLATRVMRPLEIPDNEWSISYGESYNVDGLNVYATWGGGRFTPRAAARIGRLMLQRGEWNGRVLFGPESVSRVLRFAGPPGERASKQERPPSGLGWWLNVNGFFRKLPRDAFAGAGAGQQVMMVVPSLDLVIVRNGQKMTPARTEESFWSEMEELLFNPLVEALRAASAPPYQQSKAIAGVDFAPADQIIVKAVDSDNWPITWGDDDALYTAYGDGWGFEPRVERKLSLGLARITGSPQSFQAANLRAESAERIGDGARGEKTSGMLMAGGVLYMWVRNTGNAQIAWSKDRGRTWRWGFRFEESFGSPAFLNFGKNNGGARDSFVYVYSQDGSSAYESDDRLVLARVPRREITSKDAYEFFAGFDAAGRPHWTRRLDERAGVFSFPGHCQRVDAVYHPGLRRYLLAVGYDHKGGWGLFDAPEPWGPWTTVFHTTDWGLGGTHGYRFPSKWLLDGWLVFSGVRPYDAFCVRKFTFR